MINVNTTVHMIIDSTTTELDYENAFTQMKEITKKEGHFNILLELNDTDGIMKFKSLGFLSELKWFGLKNLRKYAIVTDIDWVENFISVGNALTPGIGIKV
ncbi:STAS/SEC14 domain-containing protein [Flagellimonas alvinocaridis]|uniref:STAS/SEC14 domain-containing protein n=1 Tax=Flagellimonas alvinocaridis TaxID=2530200 RepID=A0A4S8RF27_9FLAO|nr:STAS/SEC14 domain-containing protein [Allomuricauda alvinocaridis]THV56817.1 STAS/SEC14 domain-containing protein [Allomuricauda alvinocaridis]